MFRLKKSVKPTERVYLDWAAATPLLPDAYKAMQPYLTDSFANPSAIHQEGRIAREAVEQARATLARSLQVRPEFVTFTSGGTEGNNLAIIGTIESLVAGGRSYADLAIITTNIEHPSVGVTVQALERRGVTVRYVDVTDEGKVDLAHLRTLLDEKVVLFSTAYANSEIGTVQPVHAIRKLLRTFEEDAGTQICFHLDAAQAPLWLSCQFDSLGADLVVLDAAKCCGPKGVGVLVTSRRMQLAPVTYGGGQEQGMRPGTESVANIVGAAIAIAAAQAEWRERADKVRLVRIQGVEYLLREIPAAVLNGAVADGDDRIANNINISIPGLDTEFATVVLDKHGFAVSTKSACSGAGGGASQVVLETTGDHARATATLRITLGPDTTLEQIKALTAVLKAHIEQMAGY